MSSALHQMAKDEEENKEAYEAMGEVEARETVCVVSASVQYEDTTIEAVVSNRDKAKDRVKKLAEERKERRGLDESYRWSVDDHPEHILSIEVGNTVFMAKEWEVE